MRGYLVLFSVFSTLGAAILLAPACGQQASASELVVTYYYLPG